MKKKKTLVITCGYFLIILFTLVGIIVSGKSYAIYLQNPYKSKEVTVNCSSDGIVEESSIDFKDDYIIIKFKSLKEGNTQVSATVYNELNFNEKMTVSFDCTVLPTGVIFLTGYDFGGCQFTIFGMMLLTLYTFTISLHSFRIRKKKQFFSYKTILDLALTVFFGFQSVMYMGLSYMSIFMPEVADGWRIYNSAGFIMSALFLLSIPFIILFAGFLSLSNISLIRHEGFGKNNLFGILISLFLFIGSVMCIITVLRNPNSTDIEMSFVRDAVIRTIISSSFVYFECILLSAMICTQFAAKHEPKYNQDFIVILGCKVNNEGKPLPLLRGRIDRALEFYKKQYETTGKKAFFIPSGGKGSDEIISEAESIKDYLIGQGIDNNDIYPETRSTTTLENMLFSKVIADEKMKNANILFATTNYHVFRSGMFAAKAGMTADGIGSKTKWYFWPNAQMREFIGLLVKEWKINFLFIVAVVFTSTLFANISTIVNWIVK